MAATSLVGDAESISMGTFEAENIQMSISVSIGSKSTGITQFCTGMPNPSETNVSSGEVVAASDAIWQYSFTLSRDSEFVSLSRIELTAA